jgi:hypothetical protein
MYERVFNRQVQISNLIDTRFISFFFLSFRNCLIGPELHIKLCDLAIICVAFKEDYGEVRGRKSLPLRWIPWETIVMVNKGKIKNMTTRYSFCIHFRIQ